MRWRGLFHPSRTYGAIDSSIRTSPSPSSHVDPKQGVTPETVKVVTTGRRNQWIKLALACFMGISASMAVRFWSKGGLSLDNFDPRKGILRRIDMDEKPSQDPPGIPGATESSTLAFTAVNFYHIRDGKPGVGYPWLEGVKLIEPFRDTILSVVNHRQGCHYRWEFRAGKARTLELTALGSRTEVQLTRLGENVISLEEVDDDGIVVRRIDETVMVKYVRREIRMLTNDEKEELLDAMQILWQVKSRHGGKERFGEEYMDVWQMSRLHFAASSQISCDHFHDGLGFLTSHSVFTNTFEYYLQLVNPKLTVPYWDFTIESTYAEVDGHDERVPEPQIRSPLFGTSWFGGTDPEDSQLKDGRWACTEIPEIDDPSMEGRGDVYSRLRAPWTTNARRYLSRGLGGMCGARAEGWFPWPSCETHHGLLTSHDDFYGWVWDAMYDPHGNVHIWLGGVIDCDETYEEVKKLVGERAGNTFTVMSFAHRKDMYREGVWYCSEEETSRGRQIPGLSPPVRCGCLGHNLIQGDDYKAVLRHIRLGQELLEGQDEDTKRTVVKMICDSNSNPGDHLQSISPLDPVFWPIHPTMERLWQYKLLSGTMTNMSWPDENIDASMTDGTSKREIISLYSEDCDGHRGSDVYPFGLLDGVLDDMVRTGLMDAILKSESDSGDVAGERGNATNRQAAGNTLTNRELLAALDPRRDSLTYIYDAFRWDHCMGEGFDFNDVWNASRHDLQPDSQVGLSRFPRNERSNFEREHSGAYKR